MQFGELKKKKRNVLIDFKNNKRINNNNNNGRGGQRSKWEGMFNARRRRGKGKIWELVAPNEAELFWSYKLFVLVKTYEMLV